MSVGYFPSPEYNSSVHFAAVAFFNCAHCGTCEMHNSTSHTSRQPAKKRLPTYQHNNPRDWTDVEEWLCPVWMTWLFERAPHASRMYFVYTFCDRIRLEDAAKADMWHIHILICIRNHSCGWRTTPSDYSYNCGVYIIRSGFAGGSDCNPATTTHTNPHTKTQHPATECHAFRAASAAGFESGMRMHTLTQWPHVCVRNCAPASSVVSLSQCKHMIVLWYHVHTRKRSNLLWWLKLYALLLCVRLPSGRSRFHYVVSCIAIPYRWRNVAKAHDNHACIARKVWQ